MLVLMIICLVTLVCCDYKTKVNTKNSEENLTEIAETLGFTEYKVLKEIEDRNLFITSSLKKIYEDYSETKDETLLSGLEPIDVFRLYNNAKLEEKYEVACSLINIPADINHEEFLTEWKENDITKNNDKKLLKSYLEKNDEVYQIIVDDNSAFMIIKDKDLYRLEWVSPGIWKIGWLARQ